MKSVLGFAVLLISVGVSSAKLRPQLGAVSLDDEFSKFVYETISIKPSQPADESGFFASPYGLVVRNVSVAAMIQRAYRVQEFQVFDPPNWLKSERFDVKAKTNDDVARAFERLTSGDKISARHHMLQVILAERFKLKFRVQRPQGMMFFVQQTESGNLLVSGNGVIFIVIDHVERPAPN